LEKAIVGVRKDGWPGRKDAYLEWALRPNITENRNAVEVRPGDEKLNLQHDQKKKEGKG